MDGAVGPATQAATQMETSSDTIAKISAACAAFHQALPTFGVFGKGWMNRLNRTTALAQQIAQSG